MRLLVFITVLLNVWPAWGQTFNMRYDRGNGRPQVAWNVEQASDGFIIVQGANEIDTLDDGLIVTYSTPAILRIANDGTKLWDKRIVISWHAVFVGWANCCDSLPGGGIVIGGSKQDTLQNLAVFLMVFDAQGDTVFTRDLGIPGQQWNGFSVKRTQDGGFIIVGQTDATGYLDGFAIRTDPLGNELWRRTYGVPAPQTDALVFVVELDNGDLVMGGSKYPTDPTRTHWLQRTDPSGNVITEELWPITQLGGGPHLSVLANGNLLIASNIPFAPNYLQDVFYLAEVHPSDLSIVWEETYTTPARFQVLFAAKEVPNGDLIACGVSEESGYMQGVLLRTTADGDSLWMRKYCYQDSIYTQGTGQFYDVLPTPDGGFIATGPTYRYQPVQPNFPPGYSQDAWVVKVDADGCIVPGCNSVGIAEQATNLLGALSIYPNPAHGQCTVQLSLPPSVGNGPFALTLVASDGRVVRQERIAGNGAHGLALEGLAAGIYYVHIASEGKWLTGGKVVVE